MGCVESVIEEAHEELLDSQAVIGEEHEELLDGDVGVAHARMRPNGQLDNSLK